MFKLQKRRKPYKNKKINIMIYKEKKIRKPSFFFLLNICFLMSGFSSAGGFATQNEGPLHIHFISGSAEYNSESSLKEFKKKLQQKYEDINVTTSWGEDAGDDLPHIESLAEADLMIVFTRRMILPEEQLAHITAHVENEKPVIGLKTASHAFQDFLELDARVFGGDYDGHGDDEKMMLSIDENAKEHPIMTNVQSWVRPDKIYHNPNLGPDTEVLFWGEGLDSGIYEPMAWTNLYGEKGRAFYTSMGQPADFQNENFLLMLSNAIAWTTGREQLKDR